MEEGTMEKELRQEYITKLPEGREYGFEILTPNGWYGDHEILVYQDNTIGVPRVITYEAADNMFRQWDGACRVVRYSRYFANDKLCVLTVKRYKEK